MKLFYLLLFMILSLGCSSQKSAFNLEKLDKIKSFSTSDCPEDGTCTLKIIPNKSLTLKYDDFGQLYGETIGSDQVLIEYTYKRKVPKNLADAHYSETYYFTIPKSTKELDLLDNELQKVNLVVDRRCFCKGTAGFFKITTGNLKLHIKKNELTLNGNFSNKKLPLLITKIDERVSLAQ